MKYGGDIVPCEFITAGGCIPLLIEFFCNPVKTHPLLAFGLSSESFDLGNHIRGHLLIALSAFAFAVLQAFAFPCGPEL